MQNKLITVIIVLKEKSKYLNNCLHNLENQIKKNFSVTIVSESHIILDRKFSFEINLIKTIIKKPGKKRHLGVLRSNSKYIAFIDDDAYATNNWTKNIEEYLNVFEAVTGPAISPKKEDSIISKDLYSSIYFSKFLGGAKYRYTVYKKKFEVDDFASVNFAIRKSIYLKTRGFNCLYWPGEDTFLANELALLQIKINYTPELIVFHERRGNFNSFVKQIYRYSYTRGYFAKKKIENSRKIKYFLPSILNFILILYVFFDIYLIQNILILYFVILAISTFEILIYKKKFYMLLSFMMIFISHIIYGIGFSKGIIEKNYK